MAQLRPGPFGSTERSHRSGARRRPAVVLSMLLGTLMMLTAVPLALGPARHRIDLEQVAAALAGEPCTRILEGTEWTFDPCIPEGEPLPDDVLADLELVRQERCASPTPTTSPTPTGSATATPGPTATPTDPYPSWTPTDGPSPTWSATATPTPMPTSTVAAWAAAPVAASTATGMPTSTWTTTPSPTATWWPTAGPDPTATVTTTPTGPAPTSPGTPSPTTTGTPTDPASPTPCPTTTGTPTASPSTSPSTTPSATGTPTDPPTTAPPPPPPAGCPPIVGPGADRATLEEAGKDRIECRDPQKIPDPRNPVVLVATGDSVTSAHHQFGFGAMCGNTSSDNRRLTGNNAIFSYAGRYFNNLNPNGVEYYNFARTGFTTGDIIAPPAGRADACGNPWGRAASPVGLADAVVRKAKAAGHKAYYVTTGGVNNTNWTTVLERLVNCRATEFVQNGIPGSTFTWNAIGGKAGIVTGGGGCTLRIRNPWPFGMDYFRRVGVPKYDGPAQYPGITADATAIVNTMLAAGADKIVWMLYYDINPASIDLANLGWRYLRTNAPDWVAGLIPPVVNPNRQPLIDPLWVGAVRTLINDLNKAITAGIPINGKVRAAVAPIMLGADIQDTAVGGAPHPSAAGQTKLATTLDGTFKAIP